MTTFLSSRRRFLSPHPLTTLLPRSSKALATHRPSHRLERAALAQFLTGTHGKPKDSSSRTTRCRTREVGAHLHPLGHSTRPAALLTHIAIRVCASACTLSPRHETDE